MRKKLRHDSQGFQKGNGSGLGNRSNAVKKSMRAVITQTIIAKLHEVDHTTGKENIYRLVDELFEHALSHMEIVRDAQGNPKMKDGKYVKRKIMGDLRAIQEIMDRVEGKAVTKQDEQEPDRSPIIMISDKTALAVAQQMYADMANRDLPPGVPLTIEGTVIKDKGNGSKS